MSTRRQRRALDEAASLARTSTARSLHSHGAHAIYLAPDDRGLAVVQGDSLALLRLQGGQLVPYDTVVRRVGVVPCVSWSRGGAWLTYVDGRSHVMLLDWDTGQSTRIGDIGVVAAAVAPDGQRLAAIDDHTSRFILLRSPSHLGPPSTARLPYAPFGSDHSVPAQLAFSPDGVRLAIPTETGAILVLEPARREVLRELGGYGLLLDINWLDSDTLAGCGLDGTIRIWSVRDGRERHVIEGGGVLTGLAHAPR